MLYLVEARVETVSSSSKAGRNFLPENAWTGTEKWNTDRGYFKSAVEANPWIKFRFTANVTMFGITIITRKDCCGELLKNVEIRGGISSDFEDNPVVGYFEGPGITNAEHYVPLTGFTQMDVLSLQIIGVKESLQINGLRPNYNPGSSLNFHFTIHLFV